MADCYIYYRVEPGQEPAARRALLAMLEELASAHRITGRAYRKAEEPLLWMEVYAGVGDAAALAALLETLAARHGLLDCLAEHQRRHVEHFVAFDTP